jgi:hypothetical protein
MTHQTRVMHQTRIAQHAIIFTGLACPIRLAWRQACMTFSSLLAIGFGFGSRYVP